MNWSSSIQQALAGHHAAFTPAVIYTVVGVAAFLALVRSFTGRPLRPAWFQVPAVLLRWLSLAVLAFILLNPSSTTSIPEPESHAAVLLDASASMKLKAAGGGTRWEEGKQFVNDLQTALTAASVPTAEVSVFAGESKVAPLLAASTPMLGGSETLLAGAAERLLTGFAGKNLAHIVVVSDGRIHDKQRISSMLTAARTQGVGISTKVIGVEDPPRNAAIAEVRAPKLSRPNSKVMLPVEIETTGFTDTEPLQLTLTNANGETLSSVDFTMPPASGTEPNTTQRVAKRLSFTTGNNTEKFTLTLISTNAKSPQEVTYDDNTFSFSVDSVSSKLRVLMVEGTHVMRSVGTSGHWFNDIELMTKAWDATGEIEWEVLTPLSEYVDRPNLVGVKQFVNGQMQLDNSRTFPKTREEIFKYDVMLVSDVPVGNFTNEQMQIVVDWVVERGGGFLMGGGYTSFDVGNYDKTPWEKITPVDMLSYGDGFFEQQFSISIPEAVQQHPIWQLAPDAAENKRIIATHPPFTGMNRVKRAKPGAIVLAVRPEENNEPVFAAQSYGRGRSIAYLADPNGGWAKYTVGWGPPGGPVQGRHTELGQGERFVFNEAMANMARGPVPPHPSPYYGQFWVNVVRWLGENSIRWRRDKLSGRISAAQAYAGKELPVAAEVLALSSTEALLTQDVGARLDGANSTRVRLTYDRDRREYVGHVMVPEDYVGDEVRVVFDTIASRESLTDVMSVGLQRTNQEYVDSNPDSTLLAEIATAGGGGVVTTAAEAAAAIISARKQNSSLRQRTFHQPRWAEWPWWALLVTALGLEWLIRRKGGMTQILKNEPISNPSRL